MIAIEWTYSSIQDSPYIELECSVEELTEAKKTLSDSEFVYWVQHVASGYDHLTAMEWAREEAGEDAARAAK